jgi:hypothetical protein
MRIALLWTAAIVIGSFLPTQVKQAIGTEAHSSHAAEQRRAYIRHRAGHLIAFGIDAFLFAVASTKKTHRFYYFLFTVWLGLVIEYMQHAISGFRLEHEDLRDDTVAAAVGCALGSLLASRLFTKPNARAEEPISFQ